MASNKKLDRTVRGNKCDYCDDLAVYKIPDNGIYLYLCDNCYADQDKAKELE